MTRRLGALVSGGGRTVANLLERIGRDRIPATIEVVIAHREDIAAVPRLRALGLRVEVIPAPRSGVVGEDDLGDRIDAVLESCGVDLVLLAGYLRRFRVGRRWIDRAINIHPALLPEFGGPGFYGLRVHQAVLAAGRRESGCTVHWVDERYDHGEVILQRRCPVLPDDTPESLAARVFAEEREALPEAVGRIARGLRPSHPDARSGGSPGQAPPGGR